MNPAGATRQIYWNITHIWVMYVLLLPTLAIFTYGFYRQVRKWRRGAPAARFDRPLKRLKRVFKHCRFGIVEDYRKVVPLLREKLEAIQNSPT